MHDQFKKFNELITILTEHFWCLDKNNKMGFFPLDNHLNVVNSPMHVAAKNGDLNSVQFYLEHLTIDKNPGSYLKGYYKGITPLHTAASHGKLQVVQQIKNQLGIKNPTDADGYSVLHYASFYGHLDIVRELIKDLEEKNPPSGNLKTPLHLAAENGHVKILQFYHEILPDMSTVDINGDTALHIAAHFKKFEAVKYLADLIAIDTKNEDDKTASDIAESKGYQDIVRYLKNWEKEAIKTFMKNAPSVVQNALAKFVSNVEEDPICSICQEKLTGNWGLVHEESMHAGYCENCAKRLKNDRLPCPQCRANIEAVIRVYN